MPVRSRLLVIALCALAWPLPPASAATTLPSLALDPPPPPSSPSFWSGLYVGSEVFAIAGNGSKGHVGGAAQIGYDHEFANRLVVGVDAVSGYSPALFGFGPVRGFDFAATDMMVGYDMGRWMPYVTTGVVLAKPIVGPGANYVDASQSTNNLFNAPGSLRAAPTVGAGVDYAVTPNLHVGVSVSGGTTLPPFDQ
jgi:opacity protein-like surface antigen